MMRAWPQWQPEEWAQRIAARDYESWQSIYELCVLTCRRITGPTPEERTELAGAAFLHVMSALLSDYQVTVSMRAFVSKTVLHFGYDAVGKRVPTDPLPELDDHEQKLAAPPALTRSFDELLQHDSEQTPSPDFDALIEALRMCSQALAERDRILIERGIAGEERKVIASDLGLTVTNVYVRLHRLLKRLGICLERRGLPAERVISIVRQRGETDA